MTDPRKDRCNRWIRSGSLSRHLGVPAGHLVCLRYVFPSFSVVPHYSTAHWRNRSVGDDKQTNERITVGRAHTAKVPDLRHDIPFSRLGSVQRCHSRPNDYFCRKRLPETSKQNKTATNATTRTPSLSLSLTLSLSKLFISLKKAACVNLDCCRRCR